MIKLLEYAKSGNPLIIVAGGIKSGRTDIARYIQDRVQGQIIDVKEEYWKHISPHVEDMTERERSMRSYTQYFHFLDRFRSKDDKLFAKKMFEVCDADVVPVIIDGVDNYPDFYHFLDGFSNVLPVFVQARMDDRAESVLKNKSFDGIDGLTEARKLLSDIDDNYGVNNMVSKTMYHNLGVVIGIYESSGRDSLDKRLKIMLGQLQS